MSGTKKVTYKTIRCDRWVFVDGKEVGIIQPMLGFSKWAFIPDQGFIHDTPVEADRPWENFREYIYGRTIGDVRSQISRKLYRQTDNYKRMVERMMAE